jgi:hypothetical protein
MLVLLRSAALETGLAGGIAPDILADSRPPGTSRAKGRRPARRILTLMKIALLRAWSLTISSFVNRSVAEASKSAGFSLNVTYIPFGTDL